MLKTELTQPDVNSFCTPTNSAPSPHHCWGQHSTYLELPHQYCPWQCSGFYPTLQHSEVSVSV